MSKSVSSPRWHEQAREMCIAPPKLFKKLTPCQKIALGTLYTSKRDGITHKDVAALGNIRTGLSLISAGLLNRDWLADGLCWQISSYYIEVARWSYEWAFKLGYIKLEILVIPEVAGDYAPPPDLTAAGRSFPTFRSAHTPVARGDLFTQ